MDILQGVQRSLPRIAFQSPRNFLLSLRRMTSLLGFYVVVIDDIEGRRWSCNLTWPCWNFDSVHSTSLALVSSRLCWLLLLRTPSMYMILAATSHISYQNLVTSVNPHVYEESWPSSRYRELGLQTDHPRHTYPMNAQKGSETYSVSWMYRVSIAGLQDTFQCWLNCPTCRSTCWAILPWVWLLSFW